MAIVLYQIPQIDLKMMLAMIEAHAVQTKEAIMTAFKAPDTPRLGCTKVRRLGCHVYRVLFLTPA